MVLSAILDAPSFGSIRPASASAPARLSMRQLFNVLPIRLSYPPTRRMNGAALSTLPPLHNTSTRLESGRVKISPIPFAAPRVRPLVIPSNKDCTHMSYVSFVLPAFPVPNGLLLSASLHTLRCAFPFPFLFFSSSSAYSIHPFLSLANASVLLRPLSMRWGLPMHTPPSSLSSTTSTSPSSTTSLPLVVLFICMVTAHTRLVS